MKRQALLALILVGLIALTACNPHDQRVRTWTTVDGTPVPPRLIQMQNGVEHCGTQDTWFLRTGNPGNTELSPVTQNPQEYVLDPSGAVADYHGLQSTYSESAELPEDAVFTGYVSEGEELWVSEPMLDTAVFLVAGDHVKRLPAAIPRILCG